LLDQCQGLAASALGAAFVPYEGSQVHATIAGMERLTTRASPDLHLSRNAQLRYEQDVEMRFDNLRDVLERHLPITIRWGGYRPDDRKYVGGGVQPFGRSIYFNRATRKLVLIGWPHRDGDFSVPLLLNLRDELEVACGVVHKYPNDNDFFQVLGTFNAIDSDRRRSGHLLDEIEANLAATLDRTRIDVDVTLGEVQIAQYVDTSLPRETTRALTIDEVESVSDLYRADS